MSSRHADSFIRDWNDVLIEATEMYGILTEMLFLSAGAQDGIERDCNIRNLKGAIVSCNILISNINDKIEKKTV
jgi:hypothetical protein